MNNWKLYIWRVLEGIGIIAAIFGLVLQYQSLQEQKILGAWQLITTKAGGNASKIQALEFLNSKGVPLVGVDLSIEFLVNVNLQNAYLWKTIFRGARLDYANFTNADLQNADFSFAHLHRVSFTDANLTDAIFAEAHDIDITKFDGAWVREDYPTLPTPPKGYEFVLSKTPPKDGKIFIELIKK
jgi:hypothetical protein